jgi:hypothetical protein
MGSSLHNFFSVLNRHRFVADPDPQRLSVLMPIQIQIQIRIPNPTPSFIHVGVLTFIHISAGLQCFMLLVSVKGGKLFNILDSILKFLEKSIVLLYIWLK